MTTLNIRNREIGNVTVLDLSGQISLGGGNIELRTSLRQTIAEGKENILLNLDKVSYIDSSGLGELIAGFVSLQKTGGQLKLLHLNSRVRELMTLTKLLTVFDIFELEADAVSSFKNSPASRSAKQSEIVTGELNAAAAKL